MKKSVICMVFASLLAGTALAGNDQKRGQVGATELQINPWARSSGMASSNTARIRGVESMNQNIGGLSGITGTEILFTSTKWLTGTDININALGIGQQLGENGGVLGLSLMSMDMGTFKQTTENAPDQDINFNVSVINLALGYSKKFSNSIQGGITVRVISESVPDASASGIAFDGGVQYVTSIGKGELAKDNLHIGVSLRNVGPEMTFSGDGLAYRGIVQNGTVVQALEQRSASFELPALLNIGLAYDFNMNEESRLTLAGNFVSNTASNDQFQVGAEYAFTEKFMVRAGFDYQKGIFGDSRNFAHNGPTAGASVQLPFGADLDKNVALDYSFRSSNPWSGTHSVGIKVGL
ncbi:PorV/PorQ family protein [Adhaeribacter sp. BT258]|uniref:PorV/PorQ family protein n=1 Tax=Adhaeribacter terrigena TaxID=2793070 RepID=A0ABS1BZU1_9BACT|nr:PorV/PorQ family protein [Adhaeribacter terrigena]MBK0402578.1 PorV/PorQ family protein [Adhaeribacter terrigena]